MRMPNSLSWVGAGALMLVHSHVFAQQESPLSRSPSFQVTASETASPRPQAGTTEGGFQRLSQMMNSQVTLKDGTKAGVINDFVLGPRGTIDFAVAADGNQFYSIPFNSLATNGQSGVMLNLTPAQYQQLPFFTSNNWPNFNQLATRNQMLAAFPQNGTGVTNSNPASATGASSTPFGNAELHPYGNDVLTKGSSPTNTSQPGAVGSTNARNLNANPASGVARGNALTGHHQNGTQARMPGSITGTSGIPLRNAPNHNTAGGVSTGSNNATGTGLNPRAGQINTNAANSPIQPNASVGGVPGGAPVNSNNTGGAATGGPAIGSPGSNVSGNGAATGGPAIGAGPGAGGPAIGTGTGAATGGPPVGQPNNPTTGGPTLGTGPAIGGPAVGGAGSNTSGTGAATGGPSINTPNSTSGAGTPGTGNVPR